MAIRGRHDQPNRVPGHLEVLSDLSDEGDGLGARLVEEQKLGVEKRGRYRGVGRGELVQHR